MKNLTILVAAFVILGCGRSAPPRPPEDFSPQAVRELKIEPGIDGVRFSWKTPDHDQRGKELVELDGYKLYRRDAADKEGEYQVIATVADSSVAKLQQLKSDARAADKPTRHISVDDQLQSFNYLDSTVQPGTSYLYKLVPYNQSDVDGKISAIIKINFRGQGSPVTLQSPSTFEDDEG